MGDGWDSDDEIPDDAKEEYDRLYPNHEKQQCKACTATRQKVCNNTTSKFPCARCVEKVLRCVRMKYRKLGRERTEHTGLLSLLTWSDTREAASMMASMPASAQKNTSGASATTTTRSTTTNSRAITTARSAATSRQTRRGRPGSTGGPGSSSTPGGLTGPPDPGGSRRHQRRGTSQCPSGPACMICLKRQMGDWCSAARGGTVPCQQCIDSGQAAECDLMIEQAYERHWTLEQRDEEIQGIKHGLLMTGMREWTLTTKSRRQ